MKMSALNTAIRKTEGSVKIRLDTPMGPVLVGLVKSELLAGLKARNEAVGGDRATETGMSMDRGHLVFPSAAGAYVMDDVVDDLLADDADDLLADDDLVADLLA